MLPNIVRGCLAAVAALGTVAPSAADARRGFGGRGIALGLGHYCSGYGYPTIGHA